MNLSNLIKLILDKFIELDEFNNKILNEFNNKILNEFNKI